MFCGPGFASSRRRRPLLDSCHDLGQGQRGGQSDVADAASGGAVAPVSGAAAGFALTLHAQAVVVPSKYGTRQCTGARTSDRFTGVRFLKWRLENA